MSLQLNLGQFSLNKQKEIPLETSKLYDLLIIGGGPAALSGALYAKRKGLEVGMLLGRAGGQLLDTSVVENYLGLPDLSGEGLAEAFKKQVSGLSVPMVERLATQVVPWGTGKGFDISDEFGSVYKAKTVLLATGSSPRHLDVVGESEYSGKGVAYCAICDGPLYKGRNVIVTGGGNSAVEAAIDLARIVNHVHIVHRSRFRADQVLLNELEKLANVSIHLETTVEAIEGGASVERLRAKTAQGESVVIETDAVFVEIGHIPNLGPLTGQVAVNAHGEVLIDAHHMTSIAGIFAAGDVTPEPHKQIIIAAADGAKAALDISQFLNTHA